MTIYISIVLGRHRCASVLHDLYKDALPSLDQSTALALYPAKISQRCLNVSFSFGINMTQVEVSESSSDEELLKK